MSQKGKGKRVQKNLRVSEEHAEALEEMAEDLFNSEKKQGQVVEELINLTEYAPNQLKDIVDSEAAEASNLNIDGASNPSQSYYTHSQSTSTTTDENEVSIDNMKGKNVDHADVIYDFLKEKGDVMELERATEIVENKAGYSRYRAKQKAKKALRQYYYKFDTAEITSKYKELILDKYTNAMGNHTGSDINTSEEIRISEFQNKSEEDLFGFVTETKYVDRKVVLEKLIKEWEKQASKSLKSTNQKALSEAIQKVSNEQ